MNDHDLHLVKDNVIPIFLVKVVAQWRRDTLLKARKLNKKSYLLSVEKDKAVAENVLSWPIS